jgi:hypothetical protein
MKTATRLQDPLPLFFHEASERVLYVAHGPVPLVFSIKIDDVLRHQWLNKEPVMHAQAHPFGALTGVASFAEAGTRQGLAATTVLVPGAMEATLMLWVDFCDRVAERIHDGEELGIVLSTAWTVEDARDVDLDDDDFPEDGDDDPAGVHRTEPVIR